MFPFEHLLENTLKIHMEAKKESPNFSEENDFPNFHFSGEKHVNFPGCPSSFARKIAGSGL